ncbi:hypothetical protein E4T52_00859 [Aureobasidium sp. EXF-3400]|nr:hypothetical protein E4T51_00656 [Aureobasidium sp. EXF-12344]KAI4784205.1 hypothetical protein E4T52_00859 [Aureobasidium sp. EXF-3400]
MSAEDLGMRELGQFLTTLRLLQDPSANSRMGVPALDKLLANNTTRFDPTNLSAIPASPIIEITSPGPKSGKTELLYWILASLVLGGETHITSKDAELHQEDESTRDDVRKTSDDAEGHVPEDSEIQATDSETHHETDVTHDPSPEPDHHESPPSANLPRKSHHSLPTTIALLSTSGINIPRLTQTLHQHLLSTTPTLTLSSAQGIIHSALSHIHIFQPSSLSSLVATVSSLPTYFLDPGNGSFERKIGAIIIDSPSTFFWADKAATTTGQAQSKYPALAATLKRVSTILCTPIIYTTSHFSATSTTTTTTSSSSDSAALRPQLPSPFPTLPTLRLTISRNAVAGFNRYIDAGTAVKHADGRDKAVREAGFRVRVNRWSNEGREGGNRDGEAAGFEVKIDGKGVTVL